MKALCLEDFKYCMLPDGVEDVDSLQEYLNKSYNSFVKLKVWDDSKSVAPHFIKGAIKEELSNISTISTAKIEDIYVHTEEEYVEKLLEVMKKKCIDCEHFCGDMIVDDNSREKLSLDGECIFYSKREE